jgi:8-oxo-dGTP pyrophosphatase MutT (NUDIX family)
MQDIIGAGVFFFSRATNRFLFLLRNDPRNLGNWGLPGGKMESGESLSEGIKRECIEEMQFFPEDGKLIPLQKFTNRQFTYHTFFCEIENEFLPILNDEHMGYCWIDSDQYPKPLHPGLFNSINLEVVQGKINQLINQNLTTNTSINPTSSES